MQAVCLGLSYGMAGWVGKVQEGEERSLCVQRGGVESEGKHTELGWVAYHG